MVSKNIFSWILILLCGFITAQEGLPFYDHYLLSETYLINPSYAGKDDDILKFRATHHSQWAGVEDAPSTQTLSGHARVSRRLATGLLFYHDKNGATSASGLNVTGAYHIPIGDGYSNMYEEENQFSFGISYHMLNQSFDRTKWNIQHPNDPLLKVDSYYNHYMNIGGSFFYNGIYGGISMLDLPIGDNRYIVNAIEPLPTWYFFHVGYQYNLSDQIQLEPSVLMNLNSNSERQIDVTLRSRIAMGTNAFRLGLNYRTDTDNNGTQALSISPLINLEIGRLRLGYAYRLGLTDIAQEAGDAHLISLGYDFYNPFDYR
ncbi:MAG: PorP/SprF family type IX secretion system membrane protein [Weeksellaceae bacterium]